MGVCGASTAAGAAGAWGTVSAPGLPAGGIRTEASLSHCLPAVQVPPDSTLLWLDRVNGATASAPPNTAAAAAPTMATLMTDLSHPLAPSSVQIDTLLAEA